MTDIVTRLDRWIDLPRGTIMPGDWHQHLVVDLLDAVAEIERLRGRALELQMRDLTTLRPLSGWSEDDGDVLWWLINDGRVQEAPWVGSPLDCGVLVEAHTTTRLISQVNQDHDPDPVITRVNIGGWPGYHTHWTPLPDIREIKP